jgi:hypothetical protein
MPLPDTEPDPPPANATDSVCCTGGPALKVAVTGWSEPIVTVHDPVPEHAPDQPAKVELPDGAAVSVTWVPSL